MQLVVKRPKDKQAFLDCLEELIKFIRKPLCLLSRQVETTIKLPKPKASNLNFKMQTAYKGQRFRPTYVYWLVNNFFPSFLPKIN